MRDYVVCHRQTDQVIGLITSVPDTTDSSKLAIPIGATFPGRVVCVRQRLPQDNIAGATQWNYHNLANFVPGEDPGEI